MSSARWRFQLRIRLHQPLTNAELDQLMDSAACSDWDVVRDPIGITLVVYGASAGPVNALELLWAEAAVWLAAQGCTGTVVAGEVIDEELHDAEALLPDTAELLSATDVAEVLGVSRQRVHQLHSEYTGFPAPYARLASGPIWTRPAVEAFAATWERRRPGRPARAS